MRLTAHRPPSSILSTTAGGHLGDRLDCVESLKLPVLIPVIRLPLSGVVVLAAAVRGFGFGAGADGGQAGVPGGGADLTELVADVPGRPGGFDRVGVAQVKQPPVGQAADVRPADRAESGEGLVPGSPQVRGRPRRARARWARRDGGSRRVPPGGDGDGLLLPVQPVQRMRGDRASALSARAGRARRRARRSALCGASISAAISVT